MRLFRFFVVASGLAAVVIPLSTHAYYRGIQSDLRRIDESLQGIERGIMDANTQRLKEMNDRTFRRAMKTIGDTFAPAYCPKGYRLQETATVDREIRQQMEEGSVANVLLRNKGKKFSEIAQELSRQGEKMDRLLNERNTRLQTCVKIGSAQKVKKSAQRSIQQIATSDLVYPMLSKLHVKLTDTLGTSRHLAATFDEEWRAYLDSILDDTESVIADMKLYVELARKRTLTERELTAISALNQEYKMYRDEFQAAICELEPSAGYCGQ